MRALLITNWCVIACINYVSLVRLPHMEWMMEESSQNCYLAGICCGLALGGLWKGLSSVSWGFLYTLWRSKKEEHARCKQKQKHDCGLARGCRRHRALILNSAFDCLYTRPVPEVFDFCWLNSRYAHTPLQKRSRSETRQASYQLITFTLSLGNHAYLVRPPWVFKGKVIQEQDILFILILLILPVIKHDL